MGRRRKAVHGGRDLSRRRHRRRSRPFGWFGGPTELSDDDSASQQEVEFDTPASPVPGTRAGVAGDERAVTADVTRRRAAVASSEPATVLTSISETVAPDLESRQQTTTTPTSTRAGGIFHVDVDEGAGDIDDEAGDDGLANIAAADVATSEAGGRTTESATTEPAERSRHDRAGDHRGPTTTEHSHHPRGSRSKSQPPKRPRRSRHRTITEVATTEAATTGASYHRGAPIDRTGHDGAGNH